MVTMDPVPHHKLSALFNRPKRTKALPSQLAFYLQQLLIFRLTCCAKLSTYSRGRCLESHSSLAWHFAPSHIIGMIDEFILSESAIEEYDRNRSSSSAPVEQDDPHDSLTLGVLFIKLRELLLDEEGCSPAYQELVSSLTNASLLRWYRSRSCKLHKTVRALKRHIDWRLKENINEVTLESVKDVVDTNLCTFGGPDVQQLPCLFVCVRNHNKDSFAVDHMKRYITYLLLEASAQCDNLRKLKSGFISVEKREAEEGDEKEKDIGVFKVDDSSMNDDSMAVKDAVDDDKFVLIFDLWGFGLACMDYEAIISLINMVQYQFPYMIKRIIIVNTPWIFNACWQIIKQFLPESAQQLIAFANSLSEVEQYIPTASIPDAVMLNREA